jgi:hypothetical protein
LVLPLFNLIGAVLTVLLEDIPSHKLNDIHNIRCIRKVIHTLSMLVIRSCQINLLTEKGAAPGSILAIRFGARPLREVESLQRLAYIPWFSSPQRLAYIHVVEVQVLKNTRGGLDLLFEGPIRRTREGGSEWEPIKILLEGDENSNKMNTASNTRLRLTTQVGQAHVATGVPLD